MIVVHGIIPIKPAHRDEALTLARALSEATQAEAGCVSYEFYVGLRDPNTLIPLQEWKSSTALANHFRKDHVREFMDALPQMLSGKVQRGKGKLGTALDSYRRVLSLRPSDPKASWLVAILSGKGVAEEQSRARPSRTVAQQHRLLPLIGHPPDHRRRERPRRFLVGGEVRRRAPRHPRLAANLRSGMSRSK